jgi:hypothetical protein
MLVVHEPQTPASQAWPLPQSAFAWHAGVQTPDTQTSPDAQSLLSEHVQRYAVWVAVHWAFGPHCEFVVH